MCTWGVKSYGTKRRVKKLIFQLLKLTGTVFLAISMPCITCTSLQADVYSSIDKNMETKLSNEPSSEQYALFIREERSRQAHEDTVDFDRYIEEASKEYDIEAPLLKAIIKAESNFNPLAVSYRGATGLMQIMPGNFQALQLEDPFDPKENIMAGSRYLKKLLNTFEGNIRHAIAAYNAGPYKVKRHQDVPPIQETINYVKKVMLYYSFYKD